MRCLAMVLSLVWLGAAGLPAPAAEGKILKVLQHYVDAQGRHTLSPSLYERDAYQAYLRRNPAQRAALRFDIQWKARGVETAGLRLRVEARGSLAHQDEPMVLEELARRRPGLGCWSSVTLDGDTLRPLGDIVAWRVTLWAGDRQIAEQCSFLW